MSVAIIAALLLVAPGNHCAYSPSLLLLPPEEFDQSPSKGWRELADRPGCERASAEMLKDYRQQNWGKLRPSDLHVNLFHEGQMRAEAGEYRMAVPLLLAGVDPSNTNDFEDYALGTVAFLQRDRNALTAARDRLAAQPIPPWFAEAQKKMGRKWGELPSWPMNLSVLNNLLRCFSLPYKAATSGSCQS